MWVFAVVFGVLFSPVIISVINEIVSEYIMLKYEHEEKMLELEVKRLEETNKSIQWIERQEKKND